MDCTTVSGFMVMFKHEWLSSVGDLLHIFYVTARSDAKELAC